MVSIRWYLGCLEGQLEVAGGPFRLEEGVGTAAEILPLDLCGIPHKSSLESPSTQVSRYNVRINRMNLGVDVHIYVYVHVYDIYNVYKFLYVYICIYTRDRHIVFGT